MPFGGLVSRIQYFLPLSIKHIEAPSLDECFPFVFRHSMPLSVEENLGNQLAM